MCDGGIWRMEGRRDVRWEIRDGGGAMVNG